MWIGSATAKERNSEIVAEKNSLNSNNFSTYSLKLSHFNGGHLALSIGDTSRVNPIRIISELL